MGQNSSGPCCAGTEKPEVEQTGPDPASKGHVLGPVFEHATCADVEAGLSATPVKSDLMRVDTELLRGIPLQRTLSHWLRLWGWTPSSLDTARRAELYRYSEQMAVLDMFISHTWQTAGWRKFLSLLVQSGWRSMLVFWAMGTALSFLLCASGILPSFYTSSASVIGFRDSLPMGCWVSLFGGLSSIAGLLLPICRPWRNPSCFVDAACISQTDDELMQKGIYNIGGCLAVSANLQVLWSAPYFSRLWCIFELSAYRKLNPTGKIIFAPLYMESFFAQIYFWIQVVGVILVLFRASYGNQVFVLGTFAVVSSCLVPLAHTFRQSSLERQRMMASLDTFEVTEVHCQNDFDREYIYNAIASWYGSLDAFSEYVRGPFRQEVHVPLQLPLAYHGVLTTPLIAVSVDYVLGLLQAGAPTKIVLVYILSVPVGLNLLWLPACVVLMMFACEHLPERSFGGSRYLQTLAISVAMMVLYLVGIALSVGSYMIFPSIWPVLAWVFVALLCAGLVWRRFG